MERGKRKEVGVYDDWARIQIENTPETPSDRFKNYKVMDVISFEVKTISDDETICRWENPKYKKSEE